MTNAFDQMAAMDRIEESPSGRATCRVCKKKIDQGALRFAEATEMGQRYLHLPCAATGSGPRLLGALERYEGEVPDRAALETQAKSAKGTPGAYPYLEQAKTSRSTCIACGQTIMKDTWRVAIGREVDTGMAKLIRPGYLHSKCAKGHAEVDVAKLKAQSADAPAEVLAEVG
jgi:hypothetical protein